MMSQQNENSMGKREFDLQGNRFPYQPNDEGNNTEHTHGEENLDAHITARSCDETERG